MCRAVPSGDTKDVTNTFTFGKVNIKLDEATLDKETGKATSDPRTETGNTDVRLIPGRKIAKDPTVTVLANSEACYVRMKVTVENFDNLKAVLPADKYPSYYNGSMFLLQNLCEWNSDSWECVSVNDNVYEFRYKAGAVAKAASDNALPALFKSITVPGAAVTNANIETLAKVKIIVTAEAVQAEGFADANTAWAAITTP